MKKIYKLLQLIVLSTAASSLAAQEIPRELKNLFPKTGKFTHETRSLKALTIAELRFITADTTINPGYLSVEVPLEYLNGIYNLDMSRGFETKTRTTETVMGMAYVGRKEEGPNRVAHFFGSRSGAEAMVTAWNVEKDGAASVAFEEYLNQEVDGVKATLSVAVNKESEKCLWKLVTVGGNVIYEVVLPDTLIKGKPQMPVSRVMTEVKKLIDFARTVE